MTPREGVDAHAYLIGTWNCSFTVGDKGGDYTTTWSRAMTTGQYFLIRMTDTPGGWGWKYAGVFKSRPESSAYDTTFTGKSDTYYTVDGPSYPNEKGLIETEHHQCRKAS